LFFGCVALKVIHTRLSLLLKKRVKISLEKGEISPSHLLKTGFNQLKKKGIKQKYTRDHKRTRV
jgi:hypothetical protein|tara:strand:- start:303 stop:494 length:192 start_codon:yes stop_codon:yes gene_type:complete